MRKLILVTIALSMACAGCATRHDVYIHTEPQKIDIDVHKGKRRQRQPLPKIERQP